MLHLDKYSPTHSITKRQVLKLTKNENLPICYTSTLTLFTQQHKQLTWSNKITEMIEMTYAYNKGKMKLECNNCFVLWLIGQISNIFLSEKNFRKPVCIIKLKKNLWNTNGNLRKFIFEKQMKRKLFNLFSEHQRRIGFQRQKITPL